MILKVEDTLKLGSKSLTQHTNLHNTSTLSKDLEETLKLLLKFYNKSTLTKKLEEALKLWSKS